MKTITNPKPWRKRKALSADETHRLVSESPARYRSIWRLFLVSGMRLRELAELRWGEVRTEDADIDLDESRTKARTARTVYFGRETAGMPAAMRADHGPEDHVFPNAVKWGQTGGAPVRLRPCLRALGIDGRDVDVHRLRPTFARLLDTEVDAGFRVTKELLGHSAGRGEAITFRYVRPDAAKYHAAADAVESLILHGTPTAQTERTTLQVNAG